MIRTVSTTLLYYCCTCSRYYDTYYDTYYEYKKYPILYTLYRTTNTDGINKTKKKLTRVGGFGGRRVGSSAFLASTRKLHRLRLHRGAAEQIAQQRAGAFAWLRSRKLDLYKYIPRGGKAATTVGRCWAHDQSLDCGIPLSNGRQQIGFLDCDAPS